MLARNYLKPWGEIDIVCRGKDRDIVFIEVKSKCLPFKNGMNVAGKWQESGANPEGSIGFKKKRRLIRTAQTYLLENRHEPETNWRIDAIALEINMETRRASLKHIKDAVF